MIPATSLAASRIGAYLTSTSVRRFVNHATSRPIPPVTDGIATPHDFLKRIGRGLDSSFSVDGWEAFWKMSGREMKKAGIPVKDRRYTLWCMNKYRSGVSIEDFAHEARSKPKIRGWGPKVVNGKVNRSKLHLRRDRKKKKA